MNDAPFGWESYGGKRLSNAGPATDLAHELLNLMSRYRCTRMWPEAMFIYGEPVFAVMGKNIGIRSRALTAVMVASALERLVLRMRQVSIELRGRQIIAGVSK